MWQEYQKCFTCDVLKYSRSTEAIFLIFRILDLILAMQSYPNVMIVYQVGQQMLQREWKKQQQKKRHEVILCTTAFPVPWYLLLSILNETILICTYSASFCIKWNNTVCSFLILGSLLVWVRVFQPFETTASALVFLNLSQLTYCSVSEWSSICFWNCVLSCTINTRYKAF